MAKKKKGSVFQNGGSKNSIIVPFDKIFQQDLGFLNEFHINRKRTYCNIVDLIIATNNDIAAMDADRRVLMNYLKMKHKVDLNKTGYDSGQFIQDLYETLFDDNLISIIHRYVDENYTMTLDETDLEKGKEKKQHSAGLQFTDAHGHMLLKISTAMKFVIPLVLQYVHFNPQDDTMEFLLQSFDPLFPIFSKDVDLINKLYETVYSRVIGTRYSDTVIWYYYENMGFTPDMLTLNIVKKMITDIMPKYSLDKNIIAFNHVVTNSTIQYFFQFNFPLNFKAMSLTEKDSDGLSDFDKMEINTARTNEAEISLAKVNIKLTIKQLLRQHKVELQEDELRFYERNIQSNKLQRHMLFMFFAKHFGSCSIFYNCNIREYCMLLLILKRILEDNKFLYLQNILLGKVDNNMNEKKSLNKKNLVKIVESPKYSMIINTKYPGTELNIMDSNIITKIIATVLNNKFINVLYDNDEDGEETKYQSEVLSEEILRFIEMI